jgi:hypothetical protein
MFLKIKSLVKLSHLLASAGVLLCCQALADNKLAIIQPVQTVTQADNDDIGLQKTLEQNFSPEDRARLRKALADYARNTDPEHNQIEQKRQEMKASIAKRFDECNQDNDDTLDPKEVTQCLPQVARHFNYVDADGNNLITLEELYTAQAKSEERRRAAAAKLDAKRLQNVDADIKNKAVNNKEASNSGKRPI